MSGPPSPRNTILCAAGVCPSGPSVEITYLGVAGFMIRSERHVLLTAPMFSNPPLRRVAPYPFWHGPVLEPDTALVRQLVPIEAQRASAILVGHGHYDHLLDVPFIADSLVRGALIYGGPSVRNMLAGDVGLRPRLVAVGGDSVGTISSVGEWITSRDGGFRFMALRASHAPAVSEWRWRFDFAPGTVDTMLGALPRHAWDWKAGEPYAWLIDVLDTRGRPTFRIYFQDAATDAPLGFPPASLAGRRVDVAILCVPNSRDAAPPAPDALLDSLRPRYVIAGHWESFFWTQLEGIHTNSASNLGAFGESMSRHLPADAAWSAPEPMERLWFRAAASR